MKILTNTRHYLRLCHSGLELFVYINLILTKKWSRNYGTLCKSIINCVRKKGPKCFFCNILYTRNSSGDEIANVNFLYDDIVHAVKIQ